MNKLIIGKTILFLGLLSGVNNVFAEMDNVQSHESIRAAVEQFVQSQFDQDEAVEAQVGKLDSRLRLHQCSSDLNAFWPPGARRKGNTSIGVTCESDTPWRIYIQVKLAVFKEVAVSVRPLSRGEVMSKQHIKMERRDISRLGSQYIRHIEPFIGRPVKSSINEGRVLKASMFAMPVMVSKGEKVSLLAEIAGIQVRTTGEALSDGKAGALIRVRNTASKKVVEAEVIRKGVVKIRF